MPEPAYPLAWCRLSGQVLAFDFGEKRTGVATGELTVGIATPLCTIDSERRDERFAAVARLVDEWRPALFVVGWPRHVDGERTAMTQRAEKFARQLEGRFDIPAALVDERLTSADAEDRLAEARVFGARRRAALDRSAAALILQTFFDARKGRSVR